MVKIIGRYTEAGLSASCRLLFSGYARERVRFASWGSAPVLLRQSGHAGRVAHAGKSAVWGGILRGPGETPDSERRITSIFLSQYHKAARGSESHVSTDYSGPHPHVAGTWAGAGMLTVAVADVRPEVSWLAF